jgi:hypothetical protein
MTLPAETNLPSTEAILAILARGGVVMTATQRLARQLTQQVANDGRDCHREAGDPLTRGLAH